MHHAIKCLPVDQGILCLVDRDALMDMGEIRPDDVSINIIPQKGIAVVVKEKLAVPVPEEMLDYMVENRNVSLYTFTPSLDCYVEQPVAAIELSRDAMIKAKSVYQFSKEGRVA